MPLTPEQQARQGIDPKSLRTRQEWTPAEGSTLRSGSRLHAVAGRWLDTVLLSFAAYAVVLIGLVLAPKSCGFLAALPTWLGIPLLVVVAAVTLPSIRRYPLAFVGLRHFGFYPPSWIGAAGATLVAYAHASRLPGTLQDIGCPSSLTLPPFSRVAWFCAASLGAALVLWLLLSKVAARVERSMVLRVGESAVVRGGAASQLANDAPELLRWIADDAPVSRRESDHFGRYSLAVKIATLLSSSARPSIALLGRVGSGKSSIRRMVERHLAAEHRLGSSIVVCRVGLWSYDSTDAAIRGILEAVTETLAAHVDAHPLRGLPAQYVQAIESAEGWAASIGRLLASPHSPSVLLSKYDRVAAAIGLRVVVWLEDFERYAGLAATDERREADRLAPIRGLLGTLSEFQALQVVLATTNTDARFDLEKLARFVQVIPPLEPREVFAIIQRFREACHADHFFDPVADSRSRLWPSVAADSELGAMFGILTDQEALGLLCETPRTLKQGLRLCKDAWDRLRGEVDFDDVLIVSLLRVAEPSVYGLINDSINELRFGVRGDDSKEQTRFSQELDLLLGKDSTGKRKAAVIQLVELVFAGWKFPNANKGKRKLQGFSAEHTDYWGRYVGTTTVLPEETDQSLLEAVEAWRTDRSQRLVTLLVSGVRHSAVEAFAGKLIDSTVLPDLLRDVVAAEMERTPADWNHGVDPGSVTAVWRLLFRHGVPEDRVVAALDELLRRCLPRHLVLANSLLHLFVVKDPSVRPIVEDAGARKALRATFEDRFLESYADDPAALAESLRGATGGVLLWSLWGLDRVRAKAHLREIPFPRWTALRSAILEAAKLEPAVVMPHLLNLIVLSESIFPSAGDRPEMRERFTYLPEVAARLFDLAQLSEALCAGSTIGAVGSLPEYAVAIAGIAKQMEELTGSQAPVA